jgi:CheY-like chemotaxis protein
MTDAHHLTRTPPPARPAGFPPFAHRPTHVTDTDRPPPPLSILLVDDHPDGGESSAELLRLLGYEVRLARTGAEALRVVGSFAPDVAILDIGLPDGDGYQLAERLVAALARRPVLVALTGFGGFEARSRAAGFEHHFLKPVDPAALTALLRGIAARTPPA